MSDDRSASESDSSHSPHRTWAWRVALLSPLALPWVVVLTTSSTLVFPWGMAALETGHVTWLPTYLGSTTGLPRHLAVWPLGAGCYAVALCWAAGERLGADRRVTAGLLALAAVASAWVAAGLAVEPARTAIPLGTIHLLMLAGLAYARA